MTNSEAIQSLSDSVLHMSSVLSQFQDFMNIGKKAAFDESTETTSTIEYAKQAQSQNAEVIITSNVPDQSINATVNNWNDEHPKKDPLADERAMELQITEETSEQPSYAEVTASQAVLSATGEMSKNAVLNISGGMTKKPKSDKKQSNDTEQEQHFKASEPPVNKPIVIDDGFIGVERKRNKTKQLFLTGIAENVKEYQIQSYLEDRDVTPTRITLFQSKSKGTISAKVNIPSASLPLVQHEHFWPKFVTCKPWRSNANGMKADQKARMTRLGNLSTYV